MLQRQAKLEVDVGRPSRCGQKDFTGNTSRGRVRATFEAYAAPSRRSTFDADGFSGDEPCPGNAFSEIEHVFVGIFQHPHPAHEQSNRYLSGNAKESRAAVDTRHFARGPASARVVMIVMRVEKQEIGRAHV